MAKDEMTQKEFEKYIESASEKLQNGAKPEDLTEEEKRAVEIYRQQMAQQQQNMQNIPDSEIPKYQFEQLSEQHKAKGGKRLIHFTDTEASPDDFKSLLMQNLMTAGVFDPQTKKVTKEFKDSDIIVHTGDLLQDFIDFKTMHHGLQGFLSSRIIDEGGLEGKIAEEFEEAYKKLLAVNGISEQQLREGNVNQQTLQGLQQLYFGMMPQSLSEYERNAYQTNLNTFKKHFKTAIKNDARKKYQEYKKILEEHGITPEDLVLIEGNHDVPEVMREVLSEYMPAPGSVTERKGVKFANPLSGSTGQHLGPEFIDTFGYTDIRERMENLKQESQGFQELQQYLRERNIHYTDNQLSQLMAISQQRSAHGLGTGELEQYFERRIQPEIDMTINDKKGQLIDKIPRDVDFYLMHGMPDHPQFAGFEESAALKQIENIGGGNIIHGHIHGKTTHRRGNSTLLNYGDGKTAMGIYLHDPSAERNKRLSYILSREYNETMGTFEYELIHKDQMRIQSMQKEY